MPRFGSRRRAPAASRTLAGALTAASPGAAAPARKSKYNAAGRWLEDLPGKPRTWAASEAEAVRIRQLVDLELAGTIANLQLQPRFKLVVNNHEICDFRPDFQYDVPTLPFGAYIQRTVIEEVKGMILDDYRIRMALFRALYPEFQVHVIKPGRLKGSRALWMDAHWKGRIPE